MAQARATASGRTGDPGQAWWSDALNDPWRNPDSVAVVMEPVPPGAAWQPEPEPPPPTSPKRGTVQLVAVAVAAGLLAGTLGGGLGFLAATERENAGVVLGARTPAPPPLRTSDSMAALVDRVMPAVVTIQATGRGGLAVGSGFVITPTGHILTNEHVVSDAQQGEIKVTLSDGTALPATVVGSDQEADLAVIKVERGDLKPVELADSDLVAVGDGVVAVGSPLALPGTVTSGIVSSVDRPVQTRDPTGVHRYYAGIQTDAAVNQGSSGGPLFDLSGRVIGVNSVIKSVVDGGVVGGNIGIAFAIPVNHAVRVAKELIDTGHARRTVIGAELEEDRAGGSGARVIAVDPGGPADKAGMRPGDMVIRLGNRQIQYAYELVALVRRHDPGTTVTVTFRRGGETQVTNVTLVADSK